MAELESKVKAIIAEQLNIDVGTILKSSTLIELGSDSLDAVEIAMALEEAFDFTIPPDDVDRIESVKISVGELVDYISGQNPCSSVFMAVEK